jgi:hypothetical protein
MISGGGRQMHGQSADAKAIQRRRKHGAGVLDTYFDTSTVFELRPERKSNSLVTMVALCSFVAYVRKWLPMWPVLRLLRLCGAAVLLVTLRRGSALTSLDGFVGCGRLNQKGRSRQATNFRR